MCIIALAWQKHPRFSLVVAANRDEYHQRPTTALRWWHQGIGQHGHRSARGLLAGRDEKAGGTWMGVSQQGVFGALTNVRHFINGRPQANEKAPSRGQMLWSLLSDRAPIEVSLERLKPSLPIYNGLNAMVANLHTATGDAENKNPPSLFFISNRQAVINTGLEKTQNPHLSTITSTQWIKKVDAGFYSLSNAPLARNNTMQAIWPKAERAQNQLQNRLADLSDSPLIADSKTLEPFWDILNDTEEAPDADLPQTGIDKTWEKKLSAICIVDPSYGTRSSSLFFYDKVLSMVTFIERIREPFIGEVVAERCYRFIVSSF